MVGRLCQKSSPPNGEHPLAFLAAGHGRGGLRYPVSTPDRKRESMSRFSRVFGLSALAVAIAGCGSDEPGAAAEAQAGAAGFGDAAGGGGTDTSVAGSGGSGLGPAIGDPCVPAE